MSQRYHRGLTVFIHHANKLVIVEFLVFYITRVFRATMGFLHYHDGKAMENVT